MLIREHEATPVYDDMLIETRRGRNKGSNLRINTSLHVVHSTITRIEILYNLEPSEANRSLMCPGSPHCRKSFIALAQKTCRVRVDIARALIHETDSRFGDQVTDRPQIWFPNQRYNVTMTRSHSWSNQEVKVADHGTGIWE